MRGGGPSRTADPLTFSEMKAFLAEQGLMVQKIPERLEIVDAVPRNPTGKILKHQLRDSYASLNGAVHRQGGHRHRGGVGIGRATATRLAGEGATVACVDLNAGAAEETASKITADGDGPGVAVRRATRRRSRPWWGR